MLRLLDILKHKCTCREAKYQVEDDGMEMAVSIRCSIVVETYTNPSQHDETVGQDDMQPTEKLQNVF